MLDPLESMVVMTDMNVEESPAQPAEVAQEVQPTPQPERSDDGEPSSELERLRAENEYYKQIAAGRIPKGVVVMTPGKSQRVDDIIKATPKDHFNEAYMMKQPGGRKVE